MSDRRHCMSGRRALALCAGIILASYGLLFHSSLVGKISRSPASQYADAASQWHFDASIHERDYGLADEQCDVAFPGLWTNIEMVHRHREKDGQITQSIIDKSFAGADVVRVLVYDRQIYIVDHSLTFHKNRAASILSTLHRAIVSYRGHIPNVEFALSVSDGPSAENQWALTRETGVDRTTWVVPDQGWWSWPVPLLGEYTQVRKQIAMREPEWENKTAKVAWRGVVGLSPIRAALLDASRDKPWSDIRGMSWSGNGGVGGATNKEDALTAPDHCNYQYLMYTEGATYSGRFKYLHTCKSVIITHKLKWAEFHDQQMQFEGPDQNMVLVNRDWSDLDEKMQYLLSHPDEAKRISENNARTFRDRYLTPAAQACYMRRMVKAWADLQDFEPELWIYKEDVNGHKGYDIRGVPYETWMVEPLV